MGEALQTVDGRLPNFSGESESWAGEGGVAKPRLLRTTPGVPVGSRF